MEIVSRGNKVRDSLVSLGYARAKKTLGGAKGFVTKTYGQILSQDPEFYKLTRSLEILANPENFGGETRPVLSADDPILQYLR